MRLILIIVFLILASCGNNDESGPVDIHYGQDLCERCKMIISEENFSSQIILGKGKVYNFDDIGGMAQYILENNIEPGNVKIYVKDFNTGKWLGSEGAFYVVTDNIRTPMMYGLIAVSDKRSADEIVSRHGGKVISEFKDVLTSVGNAK